MTDAKTKATSESIEKFLNSVVKAQRADAKEIVVLIEKATKEKPIMWGRVMVGFGTYQLLYSSGRQADWPIVGFSPRKQNLTLYLSGLKDEGTLLKKLGHHKVSGGCLQIKKLSDIDVSTLKKLVARSYARRKRKARLAWT